MIMKIQNNLLKYYSILLVFTLMTFIVACGSDDEDVVADDEVEEVDEGEKEEEEIEETGSNDISILEKYFYTGNTTFVVNETTIKITTKDLPDHKSMYYDTSNDLFEAYDEPDNPDFRKNPNSIDEQNIVFTIPRFPELNTSHPEPGLGPFGVAINSVVFFNQEAAPGDDIFAELNTFDQYEGHPAGTTYHYHIKPPWLTSLKGSDAFLGFLLDGFPVYGPMENDKEIFNADLDIYHGHTSATADFPDGIYHYHITEEYPWINGDAYYGTPGTRSN